MRRTIVACLLAIGVAAGARTADASITPEVTWTMVDVSVGSQADAHLVDAWGGKTILIDTGTAEGARERLVPLLRDRDVDYLDYVLITHAHRDHYGGLEVLLEHDIRFDRVFFTLPEREVCDREIPWGCDWDEVGGVVRMLKRHDVTVKPARPGARSHLSPGTLEVLYSYRGVDTPIGATDVNDTSTIARLDVGDTSVLFTGDLNHPLGQWLTGEDLDLRPRVLLKVPHHGAEALAPDAFFAHVDPDYAFVPTHRDLWCHDERSERVRNWVQEHDTIVFVNGLAGHVTVDLGFTDIEVSTERDDACEPAPATEPETEPDDPSPSEEAREDGGQPEADAEAALPAGNGTSSEGAS